MPGWTRAILASGSIDVERIHVARVVEDHGHVDALAGKAGARAARQNRSAGCAAGCQSGFDIGRVAGKNDADGKLAVVRGVGGVEGARAEIEADLAAQRFLEERFELAVRGKALMGERGKIGRTEKDEGLTGKW